MSSAALEKSLDEIIGDRPSQARHGSSRGRRGGSRISPYSQPSRDSISSRNPVNRDDQFRSVDRWSHDKYDSRTTSGDRHDDERSYRPKRNDRDSRATHLRVANIHYDLTEREVRDLFERIAPVSRFAMQFDRAGRSEGTAVVTYDKYSDARSAIAEYDGQTALGQRLEVGIDSIVPSARSPDNARDLRSRIQRDSRDRRDDRTRNAPSSASNRTRGGRLEKGSSRRRGPVTAEDLDAELDNYINQRNQGDAQKVADTGAEAVADGINDGMLID